MDVKDKAPLLIAAVLVLVAIVMYSRQAPNVSTGGNVVAPNNSSTDAANAQIAAQNAASAQSYEQTITQEFGQMVGFGAKIQDNATAVQEAGIAADVTKTQYGDALQAQLAQYKMQEQLSANQMQAQQTMYNDQLQAIKTQSNNQTKSNIFGSFFGAVASVFG